MIMNITGLLKDYKLINIQETRGIGHGDSLSVKVVIPCYCQAKCKFCFNKLTQATQQHNYEEFFNNLVKSLDLIVENLTDKRNISLDITGNEPTFDIEIFKKFLNIIAPYKKYFNKVVMTTNGFHLKELVPYMKDVIDIVNISIHHYDYDERMDIFGTRLIPNNDELKTLVNNLNDNNITVTAVTVLYKEYDNDFRKFFDNFTFWAKDLGFKDVRMRSNFYSNDPWIDKILYDIHIEEESLNSVNALTTKIIKDKRNGYETRILKGVESILKYVIGPELVIDDDGMLYVDYNKKYSIDEKTINIFENIYVK